MKTAEEFIREKEHEVENLFKDWHIEKLASEMEKYANAKAKAVLEEAAEKAAKHLLEDKWASSESVKEIIKSLKIKQT